MPTHRICRLAELVPDTPRYARIDNIDVFVALHADRVYALQNRCGHAGAALNQGECTDGLIVCPPPMALYHLSDNSRLRKFGELLEGIETLPIRTFPVEIRDGDVFVSIPEISKLESAVG